ncbi:hypothetical protein M2145_002050 [Lachnospiraceae bacterium PF1-21]|uniref:PIN domain-containing protein n=1 Tax=Ohessyouella blattaphilus TaxID=2949333 RepID=A0ABT1EJZ1_9FIRM|nr:PIN domain-containing protein [Ohessyouella blattaphilus]MCP1111024.1 hypothetical protein [Ohessyouella blattaphilus]MCR8564418.1 hypothetical protein [Ohessyouella blattaphilus]MDL2250596.1 hypothetical protein [Lachnospiraceae bacterium OttesenSCG-928-J05]
MKASLDTNVIIHLYRAGEKELLFSYFPQKLYVYSQIRDVEMTNHGRDILEEFDTDVREGKINVVTDEGLKERGVLCLFREYVKENRSLYSPQDLGEVYAISLAQTLGIWSLITDDIKQGGPYTSLLQFMDNEIVPLNYVDLLILLYLRGDFSASVTKAKFDVINNTSDLKWSMKSHIARFINRFVVSPFQASEKEWMNEYVKTYNINKKAKFNELRSLLSED